VPFVLHTDYCEGYKFNASCSWNEIIIVKSALYGRMKESICISISFGHKSSTSVLSAVEELCSGRRNCTFDVIQLSKDVGLYTKDPRCYLEVAYECLKGQWGVTVKYANILQHCFKCYKCKVLHMCSNMLFNKERSKGPMKRPISGIMFPL